MQNLIRQMRLSDKEEVLSMMKTFYSSDAVFTNGSKEIFLNDFKNCVENSPYLKGYIFQTEDVIQGYAMIAKSFSTEFGKPCYWIEDIYLKPEYRGLGIAAAFFEYLEKTFTDGIFRLEVEKENERAVYVYEKAGFSQLPYCEMKK